ncbi:MAG: hypothetical protein KDA45_17365, partial [Planctomycetales bacterium]|nr:hypothetical protein [Planctomycetales bacterium]
MDPTRWNRLSLDWLQAACPHFQWSQAAESLSESLGEAWFADTCPERPLRVLVGPPGSGIRRVLQELAEVRQLRLLPAPQAEEILASAPGDTALLRSAEPDAGEILVIPNLECWYLRHPNGLALVRNLVEWLSGFRGRVLVGCDSWAWAFLQRAAGIEDLLGEPQTLASFNARRLDAWFRDTLELPLPAFRQRGGAEAVFPLADDEGARPAGRAEGEVSSLIRSLAVRARGNPGVALALWRTSLRERETSDSAGASKVSGAEQAAGKDKATATETPPSTPSSDVWVVPSAKLDMPQFPADYDRIHRFVLHALLLHGGLTLPLLAQLLPFARHELQRRVRGLHRAGLLALP